MKMARFSATIWREGKAYLSKCPELNVASAGDTPHEAHENLKEAVELYLENAGKLGMLKELDAMMTSDEKYTTTLDLAIS
ncbi:MAG: hypothetical protein A2Z34_01160 [Planctomycetes bacterium RBG_16_59_8]|nr:MAG: hypothetical protein A2Z34_01160 [Planctomycetes bacterium RBG_16_59_8]